MNEQQYLDPTRFPLTTQPGLGLDQQTMLDSINLDELNAAMSNGATLTPQEQAIAAELRAKR
jgi:hypothetical protein